jgi:PEP-CTERM motif-containing protein
MRLLGKSGLAASVAIVLGMASTASAAPFLVANFCPQNLSCPAGLTQASLSIEANLGSVDLNDYFVTATFTGNGSAPAYLDMFSFTIAGASTPAGYTSVTLQSAPAGVTWGTFYDNVNNSPGACTGTTNQSEEVCTNSLNPAIGAPLTSNTLTFSFLVDLAGTFQISPTNGLNLRAAFNNSSGGNAGILSPDGNYTTGGTVPEPTSMVLFGLAALAAARARAARR